MLEPVNEESQLMPEKPTAEMLMQAGDALSKSLLFALERDYLDGPVFDNNSVRLLPEDPPRQTDLAFLEVEQVGKPLDEHGSEYFKAIQTTLASCHDPRYSLLFIISSDGLRNRIYLGVSARVPDAQPKIFASQLGQFLCSNWPGTRVREVADYRQVVDHVHVPLSQYRYARAFTGIPSAKSGEKPGEYPQSLDRFMRGLRGKPYVYMVIANPMPEREVSNIVTACHTLAGQVHAFTKTTIQKSTSTGTSESISKSESDSTSTSTSTSTSETKGITSSKGALGTVMEKSSKAGKVVKGAGMAGLSGLLFAAGGPFLLSGVLGMFGQLLPSSGISDSSGTSTSESESTSKSTSLSTTDGTSTGESLSFGQEYLNKNAEACVKLLDKTAIRFETAKALGCWNVGIYMISQPGGIGCPGTGAVQGTGERGSDHGGTSAGARPCLRCGTGRYKPRWMPSAIRPCACSPRKGRNGSTIRWGRRLTT